MKRTALITTSCAAAALLLVLPFLLKGYAVFQVTLVMAYAIAILGLNLLTGFGKQISLGQGAFFAIGAYASAVLQDKLDCPYWATLAVAPALCFVLGLIVGFPAMRLGGHNLALATFALAFATPQLLKHQKIDWLTGGVQGLGLDKPMPPFELTLLNRELDSDRWLYYVALLTTALVFLLIWNLLRGRIGRALIAMGDHPVAASAMGINVPRLKTVVFAISAAATGVAGALAAIAVAFVSPDSFTIALSILLLVGLLVGGLGSIPGAFFGAAFIQFVPNVADYVSKSAPAAIYGLLLILLMWLMPGGVMGAVHALWARIGGRPAHGAHKLATPVRREE